MFVFKAATCQGLSEHHLNRKLTAFLFYYINRSFNYDNPVNTFILYSAWVRTILDLFYMHYTVYVCITWTMCGFLYVLINPYIYLSIVSFYTIKPHNIYTISYLIEEKTNSGHTQSCFYVKTQLFFLKATTKN